MALWEISLFEFIRVTVLLGGGAAWLTGRATARTWSPWWRLVLYIALLTIALRFIHFSLFEGTFFLPPEDFGTALHFAAVDFVVLMIAAAIGRQVTRAGQMARQYRLPLRPRRRGRLSPPAERERTRTSTKTVSFSTKMGLSARRVEHFAPSTRVRPVSKIAAGSYRT